MVDKTIKFVLGHDRFKTLGSSRTDAKVSANHTAFELFLSEPLKEDTFLDDLNQNLPTDIRALSFKEVDSEFNIIQSSKTKEYLYLFSFGEKAHPFAASLLSAYPEMLDLELMKAGAKLFEGTHDFRVYTVKSTQKSETIRHISYCTIEPNTFYTASFFPTTSYALRVIGKGFGRYQIRMMMGQLLRLGKHEIELEEIEDSLKNPNYGLLRNIAPGSALILNKLTFEEKI